MVDPLNTEPLSQSELMDLTKSSLVEMTQLLGVSHQGNKSALVERILAAHDDLVEIVEAPTIKIHFEQTSSLSRKHFQIRAPKWCPSCGRSNNWPSADLRTVGNPFGDDLDCISCGILWRSEIESITELDDHREVIWRDEIITFGTGKYDWRAKLPGKAKPTVGLVIYNKTKVVAKSVRDHVKSTANWGAA